MQQDSDILKYDTQFLQAVSDICGLPFCMWSDTFFWGCHLHPHPCEKTANLRVALEESCISVRPVLFFENEFIFWGVLRQWKYCIAIGPVWCGIPEEHFAKKYARTHGFPTSYSIKKVSLKEMIRCLSVLTCHFQNQSVNYDQVVFQGTGTKGVRWISEEKIAQYQLVQSEYNRNHKSGADFSASIAEAVKSGDTEQVKQLLSGNIPDLYENARVAENAQKQIEYMLVSQITILTRAAVAGGMRMEEAYELGDIYLQRLASIKKEGDFNVLLWQATTEFAVKVHESQEEKRKNSYVEASKSYVVQNLRKHLKVCDIAPAIGISRTHLAHLFKAEEGITLQQYIQREKCRQAERLLRFTNYPISTISEYFGFATPSYFGVCFQYWYGVTPKQYREQNPKR